MCHLVLLPVYAPHRKYRLHNKTGVGSFDNGNSNYACMLVGDRQRLQAVEGALACLKIPLIVNITTVQLYFLNVNFKVAICLANVDLGAKRALPDILLDSSLYMRNQVKNSTHVIPASPLGF